MNSYQQKSCLLATFRVALVSVLIALAGLLQVVPSAFGADSTLAPLVKDGHAVKWWFVFKFNGKAFPGCGSDTERACIFGGKVQKYRAFGQQFAFASDDHTELRKGSGCLGDTLTDPVGATFDEIYKHHAYYVIWNDQFYGDPPIKTCLGGKGNCRSPWGHSKGILAWNDAGEGLVMQVSTPSWPASGSQEFPRKAIDGNTLGCVRDNNVLVSQHFFALKLSKEDVEKVLNALQNSSVVTDPKNRQIVNNGGPAKIQSLVEKLGTRSSSNEPTMEKLSSGVILISKPSHLNVPPWQMVSALLHGVSLRTATWWARPYIPTTTPSTRIKCWPKKFKDDKLHPGTIEIATTGIWNGTTFGLKGGLGAKFNHAKLGVSISPSMPYTIFGDLNQQGTLSGKNCASSQNGRGGMFFVVSDKLLAESVRALIEGDTASTQAP